MNKLTSYLLVASIATLTSACFRVEQHVELDTDLSGTASMRMEMNLEPMALIMAHMTKSVSGSREPPTPAEIAKAKEELLAQKNADRKDPDEVRRELEGDLPKGLELLDMKLQEHGLQTIMNLKIRFDDLAALRQLEVGNDPNNPGKDPFSSLEVREQGAFVIVSSEPFNPTIDMRKQANNSPAAGMEQLDGWLEDAFRDIGVSFRLTSPMRVVEHNATKVHGKTLIWEYGYQQLEKMGEGGGGIRVKYAR